MNCRKTAAVSVLLIIAFTGIFTANSCIHAPYVMPESQRTSDPAICFERDILPIFISSCSRSGCHGNGSHEGGYTLDSYEHIAAQGIVPGNIAASKIWETIAIIKTGESAMPRDAAALSATQLDLIKRWILAGAVDSGNCSATLCDTANYTYSAAIRPMMQLYCTGCHSTTSAPGGSLADYASVRNAAVNGNMISDIAHLPGANPMPQGGIMLSGCQITQVKKWVAAGAQNN